MLTIVNYCLGADVIPPSYDDVTKSADESENESGNANEAVGMSCTANCR